MKKKYVYLSVALVVFLAAVHYVIGFDHARDHVREIVEMIPWPKGKSEPAEPYVTHITGHYDANENVFVPDSGAASMYEVSSGFDGNLAMIRQSAQAGGQYGMVDKTGRIVIETQYDDMDLLYQKYSEIVVIQKDKNGANKKGIIDTTGRVICPAKYDDVEFFNEGLCRVELNQKAGYINSSGKEVVPPVYLDALTFVNGVACVCKEPQKWGCIDKTGKVIVPLIYFDAPDFKNGVAKVKLNLHGQYFNINTKGQKV